MMKDPTKCTVARLHDAQVGDVVWVKPYEHRRERWRLKIIGEIGKQSIICEGSRAKYNNTNGAERATSWPERLMGQLDKDDFLFMEHHQYKIGDKVSRLRDPALLRKVADLIGYDYQTTEN